MNIKDKIRTKSFWVSIISGLILILQGLGLTINVPYINEGLEAICTLLIVAGVFTSPTVKKSASEQPPKIDIKEDDTPPFDM